MSKVKLDFTFFSVKIKAVCFLSSFDVIKKVTLVIASGVDNTNYKSIKVFDIDLDPVYDLETGLVEGGIYFDYSTNNLKYVSYRTVNPLTNNINNQVSLLDKFTSFERYLTVLGDISNVLMMPAKENDVLRQLLRVVQCFEMYSVDVFKFFTDPDASTVFNIRPLDNSVSTWNLDSRNITANPDNDKILSLELKSGVTTITFALSNISPQAFGFKCGLYISYDLASDLSLNVVFVNGSNTKTDILTIKAGKGILKASIVALFNNSENGINMFVCVPIDLVAILLSDSNGVAINNFTAVYNQVPTLLNQTNLILETLPGLIKRIEKLENPTP